MSAPTHQCPACKSQSFTETHLETWCIGWIPHDGHRHNPNQHRAIYACKNGHEFELHYWRKCPADGCDWTGAQERNNNP